MWMPASLGKKDERTFQCVYTPEDYGAFSLEFFSLLLWNGNKRQERKEARQIDPDFIFFPSLCVHILTCDF